MLSNSVQFSEQFCGITLCGNSLCRGQYASGLAKENERKDLKGARALESSYMQQGKIWIQVTAAAASDDAAKCHRRVEEAAVMGSHGGHIQLSVR